jgi:hypothetical protein
MSNFITLGNVDVNSYLNRLDCVDWGSRESLLRKAAFPDHHGEVDSVPLKWTLDALRYASNVPAEKSRFYEDLYDATFFQSIEEILSEKLGCGYFVHMMLLRLPAGKKVAPHRDYGKLLENHRVHVPLVTDLGCTFTVGGEQAHLSKGAVVKIDNSKLHSVENNSSVDRVHLLVDWHCKKQQNQGTLP